MLWTGILGGAAALVGAAAERLRPAGRARGRAARAKRRVERELGRHERLTARRARALSAAARAWEGVAEGARLEEVPLTELRNFGAENVRWAALENAGIRTVADLVPVTRAALERIEGIGPLTVQRILAARKRVIEMNAAEPAAPPRLDAEQSEARALVRAAREVLVTGDHTRAASSALRTLDRDLGARLASVRHKAAIHRGWFRGDRAALRAAAVQEAAAIVTDVERARAPDGRLTAAARARAEALRAREHRPTAGELRREHERRVAEFTAVIERALTRNRGSHSTGLHGGLPLEVARRVEAFELDTAGLRVTLRGYQEFGAKYLLVQRRTLLGDEMGLGKTVEALAALAHVAYAEGGKHFLVVAPASVLSNWERETARHTELPVVVLHGSERDERLRRWARGGGVAVTSFGTLGRMPLYERNGGTPGELGDKDVDMLVVDEAHYAKNPGTARSRAVTAIAERSKRVCYMSGTPLENRIEEFRSLISQLQPELAERLGVETPADDGLVVGRQAFLTAVAPVYVRRNQKDVLQELPERIEKEEWIDLSPAELDLYRDAVGKRQIMAMRRTATLGVPGVRSSKLERLDELLQEYRADGRKVLVFSFFLNVLAAVARRERPIGTISGSVPPAERQRLCDAFTETDGYALLLGQIDAAGTGLNPQAASAVVLLEPQWKPSTEEQAIARAHRMGQTRSVIVHRLLATDTVDERMKEVLAGKQELFDAFARESAVRDASADATETSLTKQVVDAEVARLGLEEYGRPGSSPSSPG